jgi:signal transduction histidine kinase
VLLIEDDDADAQRIGSWLAHLGSRRCLWDWARDLTSARALLAGLKPDLILVDLTLPEASGLDVLRALGPWLELSAVVTLDARGTDPDSAAPSPIEAGAQDHLVKGVTDEATFHERVQNALERHRVHRGLRTQVDLLNGILSTIPEAVLAVAADGTVRICNASARALLDFASGPAAALGPLRAEPTLLERAARGDSIDELPIRCGGAHGERRDFVATVRPVQTETNDLGGLVILRDATQQREIDDHIKALNADLANSLEERTDALRVAEDANRLKMKFLEAVSHELRTPLTPILGFTRLLLRRPTQELAPEDQETLELIYDNANRLLRVVDSMLDFQALQRHSMSLDLAPTALPSLVADVAQTARSSLGGGPVQVVVEIAEGTPELLVCDGRRLGQILHRLVQNAVAHTHRGEIRIFARWTAARLTVGVRDTGVGIAPEHQARIFMAFYQVDPGTGPAHGVGLGLAYAQLLANAMGGSIQVSSEPGRGAEFTVDIPAPRVELDAEASGAGGGADPAQRGGGAAS